MQSILFNTQNDDNDDFNDGDSDSNNNHKNDDRIAYKYFYGHEVELNE